MTTQVSESILRKITKCLALSASSEPHEAAAALRQAQKLMEAHGVDQRALLAQDIGEAIVKSKASVSKMKGWELHLVTMIGKAFGCKLLWTKSRSYYEDAFGHFTLIGLKSQVELAQYTCEVMQRKLMKARAEFVKSMPGYSRQYKTTQAEGFCHGWVRAVTKTIHEFAMSPEHQRLLDDELASRSVGVVKPQQRMVGAHGMKIGEETGAGESIHRPMHGREHLKLTT